VIIGVGGVAGWILMVTLVPCDVHPAEFLAVTVYDPEETFEKTPLVLEYVVPSMLKVIPDPAGEVTVIVPVAVSHVGCINEVIGADGIADTVTLLERIVLLPHELFAVTDTFPPLVPTVTFIDVVFEVPIQPVGSVQV
jgi:hypothetical protein